MRTLLHMRYRAKASPSRCSPAEDPDAESSGRKTTPIIKIAIHAKAATASRFLLLFSTISILLCQCFPANDNFYNILSYNIVQRQRQATPGRNSLYRRLYRRQRFPTDFRNILQSRIIYKFSIQKTSPFPAKNREGDVFYFTNPFKTEHRSPCRRFRRHECLCDRSSTYSRH